MKTDTLLTARKNIAQADQLISPIPDCTAATAPFGIYLHIPFCVRKCRYCDFVTYAGRSNLIPDYVNALVGEIEAAPHRWAGPLPAITSVFWGGGTPSLLPPADLATIHNALERVFGWRTDRAKTEITLEANPETVDLAYWQAAHEAGINRVSLGVQSFQPAGLHALDRDHDASGAIRALEAARAAGIAQVSLDLIFGWVGQTAALWQADLDQAIALAPSHLSLYALTIEEGSALFADIRRGRVLAPNDDEQADRYEQAVNSLTASGYEGYEISNYAQRRATDPPGINRSQHNSLYWRNGEYLGFGVGAHSHFRGQRFGNGRMIRQYIRAIADHTHEPAFVEVIDPATAMTETMILGLRLKEGVNRAAFAARHRRTLDDAYGAQLAPLIDVGLLTDNGTAIALTTAGRLLANEVLLRFLAE